MPLALRLMSSFRLVLMSAPSSTSAKPVCATEGPAFFKLPLSTLPMYAALAVAAKAVEKNNAASVRSDHW